MDDRTYNFPDGCPILMIGNNGFGSSDLRILPDARVDDGYLDCVLPDSNKVD